MGSLLLIPIMLLFYSTTTPVCFALVQTLLFLVRDASDTQAPVTEERKDMNGCFNNRCCRKAVSGRNLW